MSVEFSDGSIFRIPIGIIALARADYFAKKEGEDDPVEVPVAFVQQLESHRAKPRRHGLHSHDELLFAVQAPGGFDVIQGIPREAPVEVSREELLARVVRGVREPGHHVTFQAVGGRRERYVENA